MPRTVDEYLLWACDGPHGDTEFVDGEVIERMAPERSEHAVYKYAAFQAFDRAARSLGGRYKVVGDGLSVTTPLGSVREPDMLVNDGPLTRGVLTAPKPILLLEGASRGTAANDRGLKLEEYFSIPTVRHYIILLPEKKTAIWHQRIDGSPDLATKIVASGSMAIEPYGLIVDVGSCFDDSAFE